MVAQENSNVLQVGVCQGPHCRGTLAVSKRPESALCGLATTDGSLLQRAYAAIWCCLTGHEGHGQDLSASLQGALLSSEVQQPPGSSRQTDSLEA